MVLLNTMGKIFLKTKIEKFIAKRVLIVIGLLSIVTITVLQQRWMVLAGLFAGGIFSILRFGSLSDMITSLLNGGNKQSVALRSVLSYVLSMITLVILMAASLLYNGWFAAGMITGILLVPFIIFINSLTEGLGITHNNFE